MELAKSIISVVAAVLTLAAVLFKLAGERRPAKRLFFAINWQAIDLPDGAVLKDVPLQTVGKLTIGLWNAGRDAIEKPRVSVFVSKSAVVSLQPAVYSALRLESVTESEVGSGKMYAVALSHINPDTVAEIELLCVNNGRERPRVQIDEPNVKTIERTPDEFLKLKRLNYANSKLLAEPGPAL